MSGLVVRRWEGPAGAQAGLVRPPLSGPALFLVDVSGSLAGGPLARAVAFTATVLQRLDPARPAGVVALGAAPGLLAPLAPAPRLLPTWPGLVARAGGRGRADLVAAARLARAELERGGGPGLAGADLVLVSDLALDPAGVEAWRALEAEGARLRAVRVPLHAPLEQAAALPADLTLGADGQELEAQAAGLADELAGPGDELLVRLEAPPLRWFVGAPGRWRRGAAPCAAELRLVGAPAAVGFLVASPGCRGRAELRRAGAPPQQDGATSDFELERAEPLEEPWSAGLPELLLPPAGGPA